MFSLAHPQSVSRGARRALHINAASNTRSALMLRLGANATNALLFLRLLRSPGHLTFVTANVALLVHLQLLSTRRKLEEQDLKYASDRDELVNFDDVVHDLDSQNEELQSQIIKLKESKANAKRQQKQKKIDHRKNPVSRDGLMSPHIMAQQLRQSTQSQNQEFLAQKYIQEREAYKKLAQMPDVVEKLFSDSQDHSIVSDLHDHVSIVDNFKDGFSELKFTKIYASTIQNSLMLLSNMIIKQFLVEINLRKALNDLELLVEYPADSSITQNDLFKRLNRKDRSEIESLLAKLAEDGAELRLNDIFDDLSHNEAFSNNALKHEDIYHYKSGHWLNYVNSDTTSHIKSNLHPKFLSPIINDEEYISKLKSLFAAYKRDSHPFKHANLALEVAKVLANGGTYSPSLSIFRVLLDKFGEIGLYNYQTLVYDTLPSFDNNEANPLSERADTDSATQGLYLKLIEKDPKYLKSLINYESRKDHVGNLKFLLKYLEPAPSNSKIATNSKTAFGLMPLFLNKTIGAKELVTSADDIHIDVKTVESALDACAKLGDYERMDRILIKLFSQSANSDTHNEVNYHDLLTDNVLLTLGESYIRRQDKVRLEWLSPLVCTRVLGNGSEKGKHVTIGKLITLSKQLESLVPTQKSKHPEVPSVKKNTVSRRTEVFSGKQNTLASQSRNPSSAAKAIQINSSKKIVPSGLSVPSNSGFIDRAVMAA